MMRRRCVAGREGSTLLLALWALVVVSAVVFAWVELIDRRIGEMGRANRGLEARALAHSGMAVALHPGVGMNSPHLEAVLGEGQSYRVKVESEGARVNINYFLAGGDPAKIAFLKSWLELQGLDLRQRDVLVDCLLDWVGPGGGTRRLNGVPETVDYRPPHRALQSLEEIAQVAGSAPLVSKAGWKEGLTLYSTGPLDIESVPAEVLALVPGIGTQRAQQFVRLREEALQREENHSGLPFDNLAHALSCLRMSLEQFGELSGFLRFREPVLHIESVGQSAKEIRQVEAIVRKVPGSKAQILWWSEK